mgnify:CR=1 FL=1
MPEEKVKKKGISIFPAFENVDDLQNWVHQFNGAEGTVAITVMMRTINTMRKLYDEAIGGRNESK